MAGTESSGSPFHPPSFSSRKVVLVNQRFQLADRNRRLVEAKTHLFDRQYRQCIAKCAEHLNYWGDAAPPLVKTYLHYLTAASHDALARDMHILSTSRLPTIELAERHYNAALEALIPPISLPSSPHTSPSKSSKQSRMDSVVDTMLPHRSPSVSPTKRAGSSTAFQTPRSQRGCTRIHEVGSAEEEDSDSNVDIVLPSRGLTVSPTKLSSPTKTTKTSITKLSSPTKSSKIPQTPKKSTDTSPSKPKKWSRTSPIKPTRTDEENKADSGSDSLYNFIPRSEATGRLIQLLDVADKAIKGVGHGDDLRWVDSDADSTSATDTSTSSDYDESLSSDDSASQPGDDASIKPIPKTTTATTTTTSIPSETLIDTLTSLTTAHDDPAADADDEDDLTHLPASTRRRMHTYALSLASLADHLRKHRAAVTALREPAATTPQEPQAPQAPQAAPPLSRPASKTAHLEPDLTYRGYGDEGWRSKMSEEEMRGRILEGRRRGWGRERWGDVGGVFRGCWEGAVEEF